MACGPGKLGLAFAHGVCPIPPARCGTPWLPPCRPLTTPPALASTSIFAAQERHYSGRVCATTRACGDPRLGVHVPRGTMPACASGGGQRRPTRVATTSPPSPPPTGLIPVSLGVDVTRASPTPQPPHLRTPRFPARLGVPRGRLAQAGVAGGPPGGCVQGHLPRGPRTPLPPWKRTSNDPQFGGGTPVLGAPRPRGPPRTPSGPAGGRGVGLARSKHPHGRVPSLAGSLKNPIPRVFPRV